MGNDMTDNVEYECRFAHQIPHRFDRESDLTFIKEIEHKNGVATPKLRMIQNFQRTFGVTKEHLRTYKDKREAEDINDLKMFHTNDRMLGANIARVLNLNRNNTQLSVLARNPYLYGADITTPTIIKQRYQNQFDVATPSTLAVLDIETNVHNDEGEPIMVSLTMKDNITIAVVDYFLEGLIVSDETIEEAFDKYLLAYRKSRNIKKIDFKIVKTPAEAVIYAINAAHRLKPDWVAVWNIDFDLPKIIKALEKEGYDTADILSDPSVPREYKYFKYTAGPSFKMTESKKRMTFSPHERWHKTVAASSFHWIDAMCVYARIRAADSNEPSYALDAILDKELGIRKLKFKEADHLTKLPWHKFMQSNYKLEYIIYCIFDCISVEELDEKTKDLSITLPELCGISEYNKFNSTPSQLADDLHFFYESKGCIITTRSDQMADDIDKEIISTQGWIITLATHLNIDKGRLALMDFPEMRTLIRTMVADLDLKSSYPYTEIFLNISKGTTKHEVIKIEGVTDDQRRQVGINLTGGTTNAVQYCNIIHKLPMLSELDELFEEDFGIKPKVSNIPALENLDQENFNK